MHGEAAGVAAACALVGLLASREVPLGVFRFQAIVYGVEENIVPVRLRLESGPI